MSSIGPFNSLVKLAARAFYDDYTTKGDKQPKIGHRDNRGMAVVILDALTRHQWVREEDLAKDLKVHSKQLRRALRFFEEEKLVTRYHRIESVKSHTAVVAAATEVQHGKERKDKAKRHTHSYCCLDYAQIYDVARYRLQHMRKKLKDESEGTNTIEEYVCPNCGRRDGEFFHCENCNRELVVECDTLTIPGRDGDDNARRSRREKIKDMCQKMDKQLKPLIKQLNIVKDITVPEFENLLAWEARAKDADRALNGSNSNDPSKSSQGYGEPLPFLRETKVVVAFSHFDGKEEDAKSESTDVGQKVVPKCMIKEGMNLTKEQRGELKQESEMDGSLSSGISGDKKTVFEDDEKKSSQEEYVKAYAAAILKQRQEPEAANKQQDMLETSDSNGPSESSLQRQVGMKFKRKDDEGDDAVDLEEAPVGATGNGTNESYKVRDLNEEAKATPTGEDDDDIDWEEG